MEVDQWFLKAEEGGVAVAENVGVITKKSVFEVMNMF